MKIIISNEITITEPSDSIKRWCEKNLVYNNPDYIKKKIMGFWLGNTPKKLQMYKVIGGKYVLPFGVIHRIWHLIKKSDYIVDFKVNKIYPRSQIKLYDYQEKAVEEMLKARNGVLVSKAGSGKGHPLDTILYTPNGKIKLGNLKVGDKLIGSNGKPITVTNIFDRGILDTYKVTFTDDTFIECDGEHLFTVQTRNHRSLNIDKWQTLSVNELKEKINKNSRRYYIPIVEPVNFEHKEVELDAWLLGALLGDGGFTNNFISFSNSEKDILNRVQEKLPNGDCLKHTLKNDYYIKKIKAGKDKPKTLQAVIKYGLINKYSYEKHIPDEYKYNDINTRLEVLRGLIDTDGSITSSKESIDITTTSKQLALDIVEIVQSLGGTAKIRARHTKYMYNGEKRNGRESYRVHIKLYKYLPFSSEKHTQKYVERKKYLKPYRIIKNIEYVGKKEIRCISVDAEDKLYVAKDFIVTHNTQIMLEIICRLGLKALWINNKKDLLNQALDRAKSNIVNCTFGTITEGKVNIGDITFSTIQTLAKIDLTSLKDEFSVIVYDEFQNCTGVPTKLTQSYKVLSQLAARYKFGCTACAHRSDGLMQAGLDLIGDIAYEVPEEAIADKIVRASVKVVHTEFEPVKSVGADGLIESFSTLITEICSNEARNKLILEVIKENPTRHIIVLSDRLNQLKKLQESLGYGLMIDGGMNSPKGKKQRREAIEKMRTGEERILFATYSLAKEGLDIPILDTLIMASPKKDKSVIIQSVGRIERKYDGKETPIVFDFVDDYSTYYTSLANMFVQRRRIYQNNKNEII